MAYKQNTDIYIFGGDNGKNMVTKIKTSPPIRYIQSNFIMNY